MANLAKVTMPQLGESVTEGTIGAWLVKPGQKVEKYESLAEVITDKVNAEIPSPYEGTIVEILAPENEALPVGTVLATIETESPVEDSAPAPAAPAPAPTPAPTPVAPTPAPAPVAAAPAPAPVATAPAPQPAAATNGNGRSAAATDSANRRLSPAVARMIEEHNLDASAIPGSGVEGRLTKIDVDNYLEGVRNGTIQAPAQPAAAAPAPAPVEAPVAPAAPAPAAPAPAPVAAAPAPAPVAPVFTGPGDQLVPLTQIRRATADHMVRSVHTSPHAWTLVEVDMNNIWNYRQSIKESFRAREGVEPSLVAFVLIEVMKAMRQHPYTNATWSDQGVVLKREINAGIAIDLGDQGLIVPVIHNAEALSFVGLARAIPDLANRARSNKLKLDEIQGSTFTLNNAGVFGSVQSMPILNQPNVINLTMEAIIKKPVVINDAIAIRPIMNMCCSFDHRVLDGAQVGRFLQTVKKGIESFSGEGLGL